MGLVSLALNSILAGGALTRFKAPDLKYSLGDFFRDAGRYAWRLLRLLVIGLICYWIVFKLLNEKLGQLVDHWTGNWTDDRLGFLGSPRRLIARGAGPGVCQSGHGLCARAAGAGRRVRAQSRPSSLRWVFLSAVSGER